MLPSAGPKYKEQSAYNWFLFSFFWHYPFTMHEMTESDQPPAYPTHAAIPPSSEATTAPAYTPRHPLVDDHDDTSPLQPSRSLPPSRPLQRPDRLELTNQSTTINIGHAAEPLANTTPTPTHPKSKDDDPGTCFMICMSAFCLTFIITWIYIAVFLTHDSEAFDKNSKTLEEVKYEMQHSKETVTQIVTAVIHETAEVTKEGHIEKVTETVAQTVNGYLPTGDAWMTRIRNDRE